MSKKLPTVYGVNLYDLDYLMNEELTENDLNDLFDTKSLLYSIIIQMFKEAGYKYKNYQIVQIIKKDNWPYRYKWKKSVRDNFEEKVIKIMKNLYSYSDVVARSKGEWFMTFYGLNVEGNKIRFDE